MAASSSTLRSRATHLRDDDPILPSLSEDLIREILCRLPLEHMMRFKCLSKYWLAMIQTDTRFAHMHLSQSARNPMLILEASRKTRSNPNLQIIERDGTNYPFSSVQMRCMKVKSFTVANSCRGLLCLFTLNYAFDPIVIWNPVMLDYIALPNDMIPLDILDVRDVTGGLGFDPSTNTYKVVRICDIINDRLEGRLHILGTETWRPIGQVLEETCMYAEHYGYDQTLLVQGTLNWLVTHGEAKAMKILSFDISEENFELKDVPSYFNRAPCLGQANRSGKHAIYSFDGIRFQVSEMNGTSNIWSAMFNIPLVPTCDPLDPIGTYSRPGKIRGTLTDDIYVVEVANRLGAYNFRNNSWEFICLISQMKNLIYGPICHVESLISPTNIVEANAANSG